MTRINKKKNKVTENKQKDLLACQIKIYDRFVFMVTRVLQKGVTDILTDKPWSFICYCQL